MSSLYRIAGTLVLVPLSSLVHAQSYLERLADVVVTNQSEYAAYEYPRGGFGSGTAPGAAPGDAPRHVVYFAAFGSTGAKPWVSDATSTGTLQLSTLETSGVVVSPFGVGAYFVADDGVNGSELYFSDGTVAGTAVAFAHGTSPIGAITKVYGRFADRLILGTDAGVAISDGTVGGTTLVLNSTQVTGVYAAQTQAYVRTSGTEYRFWRIGRTPAETLELLPPPSETSWLFPRHPTVFGDRLCTRVGASNYDGRLICTDGTQAGTRDVQPIGEPFALRLQDVVKFAPVGERLVFRDQLWDAWSTDGSADGTYRLTPLDPDYAMWGWCLAGGDHDRTYFELTDPGPDFFVWSTDGAPASLQRVGTYGSIKCDERSGVPSGSAGVDDYFWTASGLVRTDGTAANSRAYAFDATRANPPPRPIQIGNRLLVADSRAIWAYASMTPLFRDTFESAPLQP